MGMIKIENVTFQYDGMLTPIFANLNLNIDQYWRMGLIGRNGRGKTTFLKLLLGQLQSAKTNTPLLTVNDLQVKRGQQWLAQPVSFEISNHDRLILSGENGAGKSSLLAVLLPQATIEYRGTINWDHQAKVSYVTQSFEQLNGSLTAYAEKNGVAVDQFFNLLRKLGFERAYFQTPMQELSMGQKRKVSLARSLCEPANLYIWDEPLNYLDVITRQQIEDLILTVAPAMLIIDHDQLFVEHVGTQPAIEI